MPRGCRYEQRVHVPFTIPPPPEVPASQHGAGPVALRFEDLAQDGRLHVTALATGLASAAWKPIFQEPWTKPAMEAGVIPILTRIIFVGTPGPFAVDVDHDAVARWSLGHTIDASGAVDRLMLNMWVEVFGPMGLTYGGPPDGAGQRTLAGRMYAEHVVTRLFAEPHERKVTRLDLPGVEGVPPRRFEWTPPAALLALPEGAQALDAELVVDPTPLVLGLSHTDANQHVNSLVYPQLFEEAALRRLFALGKPTALLTRRAEMAFRKPAFAGEVLRVAVRAYQKGEAFGAVGVFFDEASGPAKPRVTVALELEP